MAEETRLPDGLEPEGYFTTTDDGRWVEAPEGADRARLTPLFGQAALQAQAAEIAALREALASVKNAGVPLANIAFNLAQQSGRVLDKRECVLFDKCCKHWDEAIDSALLAAKEAK